MSRAIVIVDHGSRREAANQMVDEVAREVRSALADRGDESAVRTAHLEIAPPSVAEAIDACVADGANEVVLHPFFLAPGRHSRSDLPRLAQEARERHPAVSIRVTAPLGPHVKLSEIVLERLAEPSEE